MVVGMSFHSLIVKDLFVIILESTRFTWRMKLLSGRRGVAILYAYMLLGLGFLRAVSPDFGDLANQEQELEGTFRLIANISLGFCNFQVLIIRRTSEY
jgi:hypothetical protein